MAREPGRFQRGNRLPGRQKGNRRGRSADLVVAYDGEKTEDDYLRNWRLLLGQTGVILEPVFVRSGGNALEALKNALELRGDARHFWCVFDCDDTSAHDLTAARELARREGIQLCLSTRCFEVWLALHYGRSTAPLTNERDAIALVKRSYSKYSDTNKLVPFNELYPRTNAALQNAEWLRQQATGNPSTDVDILVNTLGKRLARARAKKGRT